MSNQSGAQHVHGSPVAGPPEAPVPRGPVLPRLDDFAWHPEPELVDIVDPAVSRPALEQLGVEAWRTALDYLYGEAMRRAVAPESYEETRAAWYAPTAGELPAAPREPAKAAAVLAEFTERLAPYQLSAYHPAVLSYFTPPPLVISIVGELLAQWINQGIDVWQSGPTGAFVEEEVVRWLTDLVGYGEGSWGVLASGGTMANVMAMTVARDVHLARLRAAIAAGVAPAAARDPATLAAAGLDLYPAPPRASGLEGVRVYASDQCHYSIAKALDFLGFPAETLRILPSDGRYRLRGTTVAAAAAEDRAAGLLPLAIVGVAGTTNTGSVDAIGELAAVAEEGGLWLHVDAAYGGAALISPRDRPRVPDLAGADSITVDPHKWFFIAYDAGALLVRRHQDLRQTFHREPEYYRHGNPAEEPLHWYQYSFEGTRRFRALKLWTAWKHLGSDGLARLVERTDDLAAHLAMRIDAADDFEDALDGPPDLSVVCFRHLPGGSARGRALLAGDPAALDRYTDLLCRALLRSGEGWLSTTVLHGATWLRAGIVNYLSSVEAIDGLLDTLRRLSTEAAAEAGLPAPR